MVRKLSCPMAVAALITSLGAYLAAPGAALAAPPSLRLFAAQRRLTVQRPNLRAGAFGLGVWVTPVGGGFQLDMTRPGYRAWSASQVDPAAGTALRRVPMGMIDPARGLMQFLSIRFTTSRGRTAARRTVSFCPNGERARINGSGPQNPTYSGDCGAGSSFPFARGIVWGIDPGWAVAPSLSRFPLFLPPGISIGVLPPRLLRGLHGGVDLAPGNYAAIVSISQPYRRLFAIPAKLASVRLEVRVIPGRPVRLPFPRRPVVKHGALARRLPAPPAVAAVADPDPATLPNLVALPAWRIAARHTGGRDLLTFSATIWNAGPAPFSIEGYRRWGTNLMDAYEYFFDASGNAIGRARAGTMFYDYDRGHHHWHLRQLADYRLIGRSGAPVRSQKQSFCIAPSDAVDLTVPRAALNPLNFGSFGFGGDTCDLYSPGSIWIREQLPAGWGDTYTQAAAGQAFDITHVPNGSYRVVVRVNPLGVLRETSTRDDIAIRNVRLSGRPGARTVRVAPWNGIKG